jgi:deoxyribonuclease V
MGGAGIDEDRTSRAGVVAEAGPEACSAVTAWAAPGSSADGGTGGFAAVDVGYPGSGGARGALVVASGADFAEVLAERTAWVTEVMPYSPGLFFLRELPALRAVLAGAGTLRLVIVDGYVDLDPGGRPGLGAHVHDEFAVPVIGVAKSFFRTATHAVPVSRGASARPLFVTAAGIPLAQSVELVKNMAGRFRLPDALRRVDSLARGTRSPAASRPRK